MITPTSIADVLSAVANIATALIVGIGVWVAYGQLISWRGEYRSKRRAEIAEGVLSNVYDAIDALDGIRSPMESIKVDEEGNREPIWQIKGKRFSDSSEHFDRLRRSQVLCKAVIGRDEVDGALSDIFDVRRSVYAALSTLAQVQHMENEIDPELNMELRMAIYKMGGEHDKLSPKQNAAVEVIEQNLLPIVRLEG